MSSLLEWCDITIHESMSHCSFSDGLFDEEHVLPQRIREPHELIHVFRHHLFLFFVHWGTFLSTCARDIRGRYSWQKPPTSSSNSSLFCFYYLWRNYDVPCIHDTILLEMSNLIYSVRSHNYFGCMSVCLDCVCLTYNEPLKLTTTNTWVLRLHPQLQV